ncbi:transcriptional regulator [Desulfocurvibacter africanus PCS]|uniref:Transcriptional regulator n=1 Tax=Desulfocurvibacter africanus PCS TaxID=1262666 RepID=M5PU35_DESAF|nr:LysR substrate-binding domain-containing protein [Desulfocurvibacter africanus]EMG37862.1 transcriptional regulator [Desulfocurvibacter africanus PCS]
MDVRQLRYFLAVAEELHFGRAAERLHMAQPPLSQQIRKLEEELGATLFRRTSRSVVLTRAGEVLLVEARDILRAMDRATQKVRDTAHGLAGTIVMGLMGPALDTAVPEVLARFRQKYPDVTLHLEELLTGAQIERLLAGTLDCGIVRLFEQEVSGLATRLIHREPYVLALPAGHALARRKRVRLGQLDGQPLIIFPRRMQPMLHDAMLAALLRAGARMHISQEALTKLTTLALVAAGSGLALVPASAKRTGRPGVVFKDVDGDLPLVEIFVAWSEARPNPALDKLLAYMESMAPWDPAERGVESASSGK